LASPKRSLLTDARNGGANFASMHPLRAYATTDRGKDIWDELMHPDGPGDRDVVVYDEEMEERDADGGVSWILLALLDAVFRAVCGPPCI